MAVVRCRRCGAVVTARTENDMLSTSPGASYRSKCKSLPDRPANGVGTASECPDMKQALERAAFRTSREAGVAARTRAEGQDVKLEPRPSTAR